MTAKLLKSNWNDNNVNLLQMKAKQSKSVRNDN